MPSPARIAVGPDTIEVAYSAPDLDRPRHAMFVALDFEMVGGSAQSPYGQHAEGSTVTLPIRADRVYSAQTTDDGARKAWRTWKDSQWSTRMDVKPEFEVSTAPIAGGGFVQGGRKRSLSR